MAQMVRGEGQIVDAEYLKQIEEAHRDLHNLLSHNKQFAPIVLRMAFHDAATYDVRTNNGGPNGSIRNELNNPANKGIEKGVVFVEPVKKRHPKITYADLYQLAGIVAIEVTGGPKIPFTPGRKDVLQQQDKGSVPNPNGGAQHLRDVFHRMGLSDMDIVVLSGAHALGRAHKDRSGFDGPFTRDPLKFDNSYFVELMKGDSPGLVKFPTDKSLLKDPVFRPLVEHYAKDQKAFFRDYAASHKKLSELGFHPLDTHSHPHPQTHAHSHSHQHQHLTSHQRHAHPHSHHCSQPMPPCHGFA